MSETKPAQFVVSARKYRPQQFSSVVDQSNIVATLKNAILRQQLAHAYLFCGPRGVGKTTCARIFAKTINCLNPTPTMEACGECESCRSFDEGRSYCIHELDAASNNSVDDIRELIDKVRIPPQIGKYSVYIIDEVHMLSQAAFNAFLKTLEEPPAYALFILATTEKHKVLPTILSRCQSYDFNRISIKAMVDYLAQVAAKEDVQISPEALYVIAQKADGAMRDALTLLDQCIAVCGKEITYAEVIKNLNVLDREYYFRLIQMALEGQYDQMLVLFDEVLAKGFNALHFIGGLSAHFRDLIVCKQPHSLPLLEYGQETSDRFQAQAAVCPIAFLFKALGICATAEAGYKASHNPRLHVELALIRLSQLAAPVAQTAAAAGPATAVPTSARAAAAPTAAAPAATLTSTPTAVPTTAPAAAAPTATPTATAPTTAPTSPTATPATPSAPKLLSIKDLLGQKSEAKTSGTPTSAPQASSEPATENKPVTQEDLLRVYPQLLETVSNRPNLHAMLSKQNPQLVDGKYVLLTAINDVQKEAFEKKMSSTLDAFLRKALSNNEISVRIEVAPSETNEPSQQLYMPEAKAKFIIEQNPQLGELKKDLNLDIS